MSYVFFPGCSLDGTARRWSIWTSRTSSCGRRSARDATGQPLVHLAHWRQLMGEAPLRVFTSRASPPPTLSSLTVAALMGMPRYAR